MTDAEPVTPARAQPVLVGSTLPWPRVSVVVPTLNEARNLPHVFSRLPADVHEVIVVDGHSVDDTVAVARRLRPDVRIVQQTRRGQGNALACGFEAATGDVIAMVDADGSTDPSEIPRFVDALLSGADFAKGTRFAAGGGSSDITRLRSLGNRALGAIVNFCHGTHYSDSRARCDSQLLPWDALLRPLLRIQRVLAEVRPGTWPRCHLPSFTPG